MYVDLLNIHNHSPIGLQSVHRSFRLLLSKKEQLENKSVGKEMK